MTKSQFGAFCDGTADATLPGNQELPHAARCCLSRYRQIHGSTFEELGLLFLVSHNTAKTSYTDIMMYILMMDPFKCAPTMLNRDLTREEVRFMVYIWSFSKFFFLQRDELFRSWDQSQSVGVRRITRTLRTPQGRLVN